MNPIDFGVVLPNFNPVPPGQLVKLTRFLWTLYSLSLPGYGSNILHGAQARKEHEPY